MDSFPAPVVELSAKQDKPNRYYCGTLVYTKIGLCLLFFWLLWADFSFTLMSAIWHNIIPLTLKGQGASNSIIAIIMTTVPNAMNFVMNPIISTASDRVRGRWGRRIPFLLFSTPFIVLFLALLGFSTDLGRLLNLAMKAYCPTLSVEATTVALIGVLVVAFLFWDLFAATVFWYLFNDVVPVQFMGRFLGLFRVVTSLATALFNFFILQYAVSHTAVIFIFGSILYGTTFLLLAANVKEGTYPAPATSAGKHPIKWVINFVTECFGHRIFRRIFACNAFLGASNAVHVFLLFMALSIGLELGQYGKVTGAAAFVGMLLMYPMGSLVDRFHPLRVMIVSNLVLCLVGSVQLVFLFHDFSKPVTFWIYTGVAALAIPLSVANISAGLPLLMRLLPREKFGQFSAANAMCVAVGTIVGGAVAGVCLDLLKKKFSGDYCYRFVPVWTAIFTVLAVGMMVSVFREWQRLGGDLGYSPPGSKSLGATATITSEPGAAV